MTDWSEEGLKNVVRVGGGLAYSSISHYAAMFFFVLSANYCYAFGFCA